MSIKILFARKDEIEQLGERPQCHGSLHCVADANVLVQQRSWDVEHGTMLGAVHPYCHFHAKQALQVDTPEYIATCANCGCKQGVN